MAFINPNHRASHFRSENDVVVCELCPHRCRLEPDSFGICNSRKNLDGQLVAYNYGRISSLAVDPIEKKPLYHFHPGSSVFSVGGIGCNLHCEYCQNYSISMSAIGKKRTTFKSAADLAALCRQQGYDKIAFTYNEPAIWFEYILDVKKEDPELKIVIVTNGMISKEPLEELCGHVDAFNIDVKAFNNAFYRRLCGGDLESVKESCITVFRSNAHLELTYLVIPGYNDSDGEISEFTEWVRDELSPYVPVHFTRFHPDYNMMTVPMTPIDTLLRAKTIAEGNGLKYTYVGNIIGKDTADTHCPECNATVIERTGYRVYVTGLSDGRCSACGHRMEIVMDQPIPDDSQ
ncbi:MAG: AmmeMemoRadiSam system radical SAM enzyme [archaeon]|nr:AmmeMemoRadiSam system radical SAM enzyme [archaeon]